MKMFSSFIVVGLICFIASIIYDTTKLTPGHITSLFVVVGALLGFFGIYDYLIKKCGYGLSLPITSFGNLLYKSAIDGIHKNGLLGVFKDLYVTTSLGISSTIVLSFYMALICKPKD